MMSQEYAMAAAGGVLIGLASVLLLWLNGRIAGISGIMNGVFSRSFADAGWRAAFIAGLLVGGLLYQAVTGAALLDPRGFPLWMTLAAGLLVGYGTRLGSGCTSGHGICGIGRLSLRSIVATVIFVAIGMLVASNVTKVLA